jgi:hypothetical protein
MSLQCSFLTGFIHPQTSKQTKKHHHVTSKLHKKSVTVKNKKWSVHIDGLFNNNINTRSATVRESGMTFSVISIENISSQLPFFRNKGWERPTFEIAYARDCRHLLEYNSLIIYLVFARDTSLFGVHLHGTSWSWGIHIIGSPGMHTYLCREYGHSFIAVGAHLVCIGLCRVGTLWR